MPESLAKSDQELLRDFATRRDEDAFAMLVSRHRGLAFATAYRICGNAMDAEEAVQHGFTTLSRKVRQGAEIQSLGAWLHRVVVHEAVKIRKKQHFRKDRERLAQKHQEMAREGRDPIAELRPVLDEALNSLRGSDRVVLTLHYLEGRSFKCIASQLGGTAGAWQKRSIRALEALSKRLRHQGVPVSIAALTSFLAASRAEAAASTPTMSSLLPYGRDAVTRPSAGNGITSLLMTSMKAGIALSFAMGTLAVCGWKFIVPPLVARAGFSSGDVSPGISVPSSPRFARTGVRPTAFSLEWVRQLMSEYEESEGRDSRLESHLRSLMFLAPPEHFEELLDLIASAKDRARYQPIAAALFARWAEENPEEALARLDAVPEFAAEGYRAVLITWLNMHGDSALEYVSARKEEADLKILREFLEYQCERHPRDAARMVDQIAEDWPEADRPLFEQVARLWARSEPLEAGNWVASYPDEKVKNPLLRSMAVDVAKVRGFEGLEVANHIEDAHERALARNDAIYWWGTTSGGYSISPDSRPVRNLSTGFPEDWTAENIVTFSKSFMINFSKDLPKLLELAEGEDQRALVYEGSVKGSAWSNPAAAKDSIAQLPADFGSTQMGRETLRAFMLRWSEMDASSAGRWLAEQPNTPNIQVMREAQSGRAAR
ncbi:RNA polymerase sigma factor (sigma-70 family) [Haloferula luteola]|uniref:RNA polymerase sigma factor (Sigma-70 family) n=1 Tax=Haloferula luteola TaxID=595692 RepID=A0A840V593_9BACT|nr:sigma-70 family RNA polymerase sigma factor [Haloferula luteola]MBB5349958.1 RNA polymerase sigma factor (sigma-70 family) [Haloferula luteola]